MNTYYTKSELKSLGIKNIGENVYIGKNVVLYHPEKLKIGHDVRIDDFTIISGYVELHNYIHISQFCGLYGGQEGIEMHDFSGMSSKCTVYAVSDDYSGASMTNPTIPDKYCLSIESKVVFERHTIIGASTVVLPGVRLREGSAIGSMSLCIKDTLPWTLNVGIPAKKIKERSKKILSIEQEFIKSIGED